MIFEIILNLLALEEPGLAKCGFYLERFLSVFYLFLYLYVSIYKDIYIYIYIYIYKSKLLGTRKLNFMYRSQNEELF